MNLVKPDREDVWVLVDGAGQPCLRWVRHGEPTSRERQDSAKQASPAYAPYSWHRYALAPVCAKGGECGMPTCGNQEAK